MPQDVCFLVDGHEYPLSEPIATVLSENLMSFDPEKGEGARRSIARSIELSLVDPLEGPIEPTPEELLALENTLDLMVSGRVREVCILCRAVRDALGFEPSQLLERLIGDDP